jgi:flagellar motor switch protein FliM
MSRLEPILSREEIEALIGEAANHRGGDARSRRSRTQALGIDLLADDRHLRLLLPTLQVGFARLAESLRRVLTSVLRNKVEVRDEAPEVVSGRGLVSIAARAACIIALRVTTADGTRGFAVLALDPVFTFRVIERMFGGGSGPPQTPTGRSPTSLERRMLTRALTPLFEALDTALEPAGHFSFEVHSVESRLDLVPGYGPDTTALHVPFMLDIAGQIASFSLSLPATVLEPLRGRLDAFAPVDLSGSLMPQMIREVPVTLAVVLGHATMSLRQLMRLQPGTVLALDRGRSEELAVEVEGTTKWAGTPIQQDGVVAVEITRRVP